MNPDVNARQEWCAEIEKHANAILLQLFDLSTANAPIVASYCRDVADSIAHHVGGVREGLAAIGEIDKVRDVIDHKFPEPSRPAESQGPRCPKCGFVMCQQFDNKAHQRLR